MKDFSIFPRIVFGLMAVLLALTVLPTMLAPYTTAITVVVILLIISWVVGRSRHQKKHR